MTIDWDRKRNHENWVNSFNFDSRKSMIEYYYHRAFKSLREVAEYFGVSTYAIRDVINQDNIAHRQRGGPNYKGKPGCLTRELIAKGKEYCETNSIETMVLREGEQVTKDKIHNIKKVLRKRGWNVFSDTIMSRRRKQMGGMFGGMKYNEE